MAHAKDAKFALKVMINKHKNKVLFAAVDSNFADVLLSFLTMPLGTIVRVLKKYYGDKAPPIGSLTTLYNGLANLKNDYFETEGGKNILLYPRSTFEAECRELKLDISDTQSIKYFCCDNWKCSRTRSLNISTYYGNGRCPCGRLKTVVGIKKSEEAAAGVFTINPASFLISDDLRMVPNVAVPITQTLINLGITDMDGAELRNVTFGFNEIMDLLKASLLSSTPLTDIILNKSQMNSAATKYEPGTLLHQIDKQATSNSKKMDLKIMVQKSTNRILLAGAEKDFVDYLFRLLAIPLAGVEFLLGGNTCLTSIDNLYRSIVNFMDDEYFVTRDIKHRLIEPNIPRGYMLINQILPLSEQTVIYYNTDYKQQKDWMTYYNGGFAAAVLCTELAGNYVKGPKTYMVTDGLTVTPSCMTSSLSILNELKIPLSDVEEVEVQIGLEEALSILRASLTSTCALTNALITNPMLRKQPKQEH